MNRLKIRQWLLLAIGIGLFSILIAQVGVGVIFAEISNLKWNIFPIILVYALVYSLDTLGWKFSFSSGVSKTNFLRLFYVRLAGEAINNTTPSGYLGGEPVKALLLSQHGVSIPQTLASLVAAKTTLTLSQIVFIFIGLALAFVRLEIPTRFFNGMLFLLGTLTVLVLLFLVYQQRGLFAGLAKILIRLKIGHGFFTKKMEKILELEKHLAQFYRSARDRFFLSILFHFLGWLAGILEIYLIMFYLGEPISFYDALILETLHQLVRGLAFMVPLNLGTQEGGSLFIFNLFGYGAVLALSTSLIRRIRELTWAGIGWGILLINSKFQKFKL